MATGVFYRGGGQFGLGSSDGLAIYEGIWTQSGADITVRYRLVDAEISFTGIEKVMATELTAHPMLRGKTLSFEYVRPDNNRTFPFQFEAASSLSEKLRPRFVECSAPIPGRPHN